MWGAVDNPARLTASSRSRVCSTVAAGKDASNEAVDAWSKAYGGWLTFSLLMAFFVCFPGVSVTSSNTGVPDISSSVYNKTQVNNTGLSSLKPG